MKIMQVITDYVMKSILTTHGDLLMRGTSQPVRFTPGASGALIVSAGAGTPPVWSKSFGGVTTEGDLIVRGATICERLAAVAVGQVFQSAGTGTIPVWGIPFIAGANMATGSYSYGATGDEVVSGLGFKPGLVIFVARDDSVPGPGYSIGFDDGTVKMAVGAANDDSDVTIGVTASMRFERTAGNTLISSISAIGADGFTVSHVVSGTCVALICWFAIG